MAHACMHDNPLSRLYYHSILKRLNSCCLTRKRARALLILNIYNRGFPSVNPSVDLGQGAFSILALKSDYF